MDRRFVTSGQGDIRVEGLGVAQQTIARRAADASAAAPDLARRGRHPRGASRPRRSGRGRPVDERHAGLRPPDPVRRRGGAIHARRHLGARAGGAVTRASELARHLRRVVRSDRVLAAIASIPRERFVPPAERRRAYENVALPIACGQTISQPLVVARMLEVLELKPSDRVLDVGTGSGYHAALLALLAAHVWTIERHRELAEQAEEAIAALGIDNVTFVVGDGWNGLPDRAPFDAINIAAATGESPPLTLQDQLAEGGRLVAPVGTADQRLTLTLRTADGFTQSRLEAVRFVPLIHDGDA